MKKIILVAVSIVVFCSVFTSCGVKESEEGNPVVLKTMLMGSKPNRMDDILNEFYRQTEDTLNMRLDIEWNVNADHREKLKLKMAAGEEYDLVFDATWLNLKTHAPDGIYQPLEQYFNDPKYPALKENFSADIIESNHMFGHLYAIPIMRTYGSGVDCIYYRQDLADKYGIGDVDSYDKLQQYLEAILANEPQMIPIGLLGTRGFFNMWNPDPIVAYENNVTGVNAGNVGFVILLSEDGRSVKAIAAKGDPDSKFADFPAPLNRDRNVDKILKIREWNKYAERDSINQKDAYSLFISGKSAANIDNLDSYERMPASLEASIPGAKLGTFIYNSRIRAMEKGAVVSTFIGNNFLAVPTTSKKIEKTMEFLNWVYSSKDNHDLFELGIEGVHWIAEGDDKYSVPSDVDPLLNYNFPAYTLTWNPNMVRFNSGLSPDIIKYKEYELAKDVYVKDLLAGFNFDPEPVKTQIAKIKPILDEVTMPINNGILDDPVNAQLENTAKARQNGLNDIEQEVVKQLNEFLSNR